MAAAENQQHSFPTIPPSLSAGDHEMRDYYTAQDAPRPTPNQAPYLTPYLGLRARLSQTPLNRWTILALLVLVKALFFVAGLNDTLDSARREALSACTKVESAGSTLASLPHYSAQGINELTAHGVNKAVDGLMSMLMLSVTGVEELVVFAINSMTQTYLCLITFAVTGGLHLALDAAEDITGFVNKTLPAIGSEIQDGVNSFEGDLNKFIGALDSIPEVFGGKAGAVPTLNVNGSIAKLNNLQLPSGIDDQISKINASIPTFADVNNFTQTALRLPFEEVKKLLNSSLPNYTFNGSVFPVPQKEQLSFCSDNNGINDFFDGLVHIANIGKIIFIVVMVLAAVLAMAPMWWRELRRWRMLQRRAALVSKNAFDPMDVVYIASRPYTSTFGIKIASKFSSIRNQVLVRWAVAYATTIPMLFVLSLGIAGLFACLMQFILLKSIQHEVPDLTNEVANFTAKVVNSLNNASEQWALGANKVILDTSNTINDDMLGWVNISTGALNDTLNKFVDTTTDVLNKTFGGTPLYDPITEVLNCLIGLKIAGIQKGLTWVHDNAHVDFPLLSNNTFSLGAVADSSGSGGAQALLANPGGEAADDISNAINDAVKKLVSGIRQEAIIASFLVLLWVLYTLGGIIRCIVISRSSAKTRAEGGQSYVIDPETDNYRGHDRPSSMAPPYEEAYGNKQSPSYTLRPHPFPTFDPNSSDDFADEKLGAVNSGLAAPHRPGPDRQSSYGALQGTSPVDDEKSSGNPFADPPR